MHDIIMWLESHEIAGERKSVYEDIHALQEYGLTIEYFPDDKTYRLIERSMELAELKLLVDAIHASKFISKKMSAQMLENVMDMASCYQRSELKRDIYSEKPKAQNSVGFYSMDSLHEAMAHNHQVSFQYSVWNLEKKLVHKHEGARYQVSPWLMIWADENYYLVAYDARQKRLKHFRVDKISNVKVEESIREGETEFKKEDITNYSTNHFGMYSGEQRRVTLEFENSLIGVVLDRFGTEVQVMKTDDNHFKAALLVVVSSQFFGWMFALGSQVKVLTEEVAVQYKEYLKKTLAIYTE